MIDKQPLESVEREIYSKRQTVRYDVRDMTVEALVDKYEYSLSTDVLSKKKKYNFIYVPEYQRDFTWDLDRQSKLIESIVLGLPIPFIFVAENKDSSWEIVDGSQRIRTLHAFVRNNLCLNNLQSVSSLNGYKFDELDESRQGKILNTALRIIVLSEETTDDVKKDMFERINRGSDLLKPMEKRKGIYTGDFCTFLYNYCETNEKFKKLVEIDKWLVKRQEREELLLRFFAITDTESYAKGVREGIAVFLDNYLEKKNNELSEKNEKETKEILDAYANKINNVVDYVEKNFPYGFRHKQNPQTKRSVFEAISVGVWLALKNGKALESLDVEHVKDVLDSSKFKQYTHVANELHRKPKLKGRVQIIYQLVTGTEDSI